ncbi:Enhancer of polycomb-like 1 [Hondaea fermentalgiana]|uniref:Enhancer of polycomb-like protein n=1 Tax=Hondaea fermentalgiana TaxID=2315210 RepID=A0A2R5GDA7_9STRA|nr:Enhancer of polycomb-like 1 [Hondaea fermentalgiana]|eukprot:GBG28545.1 Enhancer of polycomb-like 1 [Hondaea fermentalgiana]
MSQRRPGFRPRPLEVYKQLQVVRDAAQFEAIDEDDDGVATPTPTPTPTPPVPAAAAAAAASAADKSKEKSPAAEKDAPAEDKPKEKDDKPETVKVDASKGDNKGPNGEPHVVPGTLTEQFNLEQQGPKKQKKATFNLPVPETQRVASFDKVVPGTFRPNNAYVRYRPDHIDDHNFSGPVEYELSLEDEEWLRSHPKFKPDGPFPLSEDDLERMIDLFERRTGREFPIGVDIAMQIVQKYMDLNLRSKENTVVQDVYAWWFQRRQKLRKPLLRRFWPATAADDSSPNLTFRPLEKERYRLRKKRQNNMDSYEKMLQLKNDFEMMRCLLDLVRRREHLREIEADLLQDEFEQNLDDIVYGSGRAPPRESLAPAEIRVGPLIPEEYEAIFSIYPAPTASSVGTPTPSVLERGPSEAGGSIDVSLLENDADARKKKKKTKKAGKKRALEEAILAAGATATPGAEMGGAAINPLAADATTVKKKKKKKIKTGVNDGQQPTSATGATAPAAAGLAPGGVVDPGSLAAGGAGSSGADTGVPGGAPGAAGAMPPPRPKKPSKPPIFLRSIENFAHYATQDFEVMHPAVPTWPPPNQSLIEFQRRQLQNSSSSGAPSLDPTVEHEYPRKLYYHNLAPPLKAQRSVYKERQRYRCRGRIGRGGRILMDRIPVAETQGGVGGTGTQAYFQARKQQICDEYVGRSPLQSGQDFLDPSKPRSMYGAGLDRSARPVTLSAHARTKLQSIYAREDSEDEEIEVIEYPYVSAPLRPDPEESARLEAMATKDRVQTIREAKFRFLLQ